jgi:sulfatase maturation enzyme AslB (radical SAM superfamily)
MPEWSHNRRWNPFNSYKLLAHVEEWKKIKRGDCIPAPILVTVDPSNVCNLNCAWCNAEYIRNKSHSMLSRDVLNKVADYLPYWANCKPGVRAVCIAGGGEPLTNKHTGEFIDRLVKNGVEVGVVTNGTLINEFIEPLSKCTWVGVSIDAGTSQTYEKYKGSGQFNKVINAIQNLVKYSKNNETTLGSSRPSYGVNYKYLLYGDNISEISEAANIAKNIGCKNIHFRPAGTPWDKIGSSDIKFNDLNIQTFNTQIEKAMEIDGPDFGVYGITHKFNSQFEKNNCFSKCYSVFMTAVFEPGSIEGSFSLGLCCDRRGDKRLELLSDCFDPIEIYGAWGGFSHWLIHDTIRVSECPRCTYQPHNEIYENVILNDSMTHKFI